VAQKPATAAKVAQSAAVISTPSSTMRGKEKIKAGRTKTFFTQSAGLSS
jgi:hypothetical protein